MISYGFAVIFYADKGKPIPGQAQSVPGRGYYADGYYIFHMCAGGKSQEDKEDLDFNFTRWDACCFLNRTPE